MKIDYKNPAIDSLSVWTPFPIFESGTENIDTILEVNDRTGEIIKETQKPVFLEIDGIKFRVAKVSLFGRDYIVSTWHSKMLVYLFKKGDNYFRGITYLKFKQYAETWLNAVGLKVNINEFIASSFCTDIDFKVDFQMMESQYQDILIRYSQVPTAKLYKSKPHSVLDIPTFSGLTFVNRNDATHKAPFVKLYSKLEELNERSHEFKYKFLPAWENRYLRRLECTVKNTRHIKKLAKMRKLPGKFNDGAKLQDLLLLKPDYIVKLCEYMLSQSLGMGGIQYEMNVPDPDRPPPKITPTCFMFGALVHELMMEGHSFQNIEGLFEGYPTDDKYKSVAKSRIKSNIKKGLEYYRKRFDFTDLRITRHDAFLKPLSSQAKKRLEQIEKRAENSSNDPK